MLSPLLSDLLGAFIQFSNFGLDSIIIVTLSRHSSKSQHSKGCYVICIAQRELTPGEFGDNMSLLGLSCQLTVRSEPPVSKTVIGASGNSGGDWGESRGKKNHRVWTGIPSSYIALLICKLWLHFKKKYFNIFKDLFEKQSCRKRGGGRERLSPPGILPKWLKSQLCQSEAGSTQDKQECTALELAPLWVASITGAAALTTPQCCLCTS